MKKRIIPLLTFVIIFSCFKKSEGLKQTEIPGLMNQFMYMHVQYHEFNDELSARTLDNYIMLLDYGKYHFYKEDVEKFQKYRTQLDDLAASDNFDAVFEIFMVFKKRFKENMDLVNELMKLPYDFNVDEKINVDRDTVDYARDRNEMKERWRKSIKLQLLNYMSAGKDLDYAKKKLLKKYELSEKRTDEISNEDILSRFMNAWSMALDPHSNYLTQDENQDFKIAMELKLEGIGVRLKSEDGFVIVESIIPGGATDKLPDSIRLKPSDKIVAVSQGASGEWTDVIDMDLRDVVSKIRGKKGSEVRLTIMRETAESDKPLRMVVPIIREEIQLQDSDAKSEVYAMNSGDRNARIGYLNLPSFYQDAEDGKTSAGDIRIQLESLTKKGIDALVLDLRGNPGGLLNEAIDIAGVFIDSGPVVQIKDGRRPPQVYSDGESGMLYDGPMVVLVDKFSASASEILAGAIKDYRRGLIIGPGNTFGKGTVQSYNELGGRRGAIKVTTHIFYQPSGTSNQLNGISPDIIIPDMNSIWDIGEAREKYPLKWAPIPRAPFRPANNVTPAIVQQLQSLSHNRVRSSSEFRELQVKIEKFKKQLNTKTISLKEESTIEKQREKELEKTLDKDKSRKLIDIKNDLFLREAFNVTLDYLRTQQKQK